MLGLTFRSARSVAVKKFLIVMGTLKGAPSKTNMIFLLEIS